MWIQRRLLNLDEMCMEVPTQAKQVDINFNCFPLSRPPPLLSICSVSVEKKHKSKVHIFREKVNRGKGLFFCRAVLSRSRSTNTTSCFSSCVRANMRDLLIYFLFIYFSNSGLAHRHARPSTLRHPQYWRGLSELCVLIGFFIFCTLMFRIDFLIGLWSELYCDYGNAEFLKIAFFSNFFFRNSCSPSFRPWSGDGGCCS